MIAYTSPPAGHACHKVTNPPDAYGFYGRVIGADGYTLTIHSGAQIFGPTTPEPSSLVLLGGLSLGGCAVGVVRRFRKKEVALVSRPEFRS
jgi:hypothetical protein